ncbi:unnamed protein product [Orchesella dallaii]|uniref:Uncharacterized protein n=1 Tax=Orchesella dallaii TaxID=48710 RepID=A0ABP1QAK1_9HEXA
MDLLPIRSSHYFIKILHRVFLCWIECIWPERKVKCERTLLYVFRWLCVYTEKHAHALLSVHDGSFRWFVGRQGKRHTHTGSMHLILVVIQVDKKVISYYGQTGNVLSELSELKGKRGELNK